MNVHPFLWVKTVSFGGYAFEQINAFDSRCDHRYPSRESGRWSGSLGSSASRRRTQFTTFRGSIPDGECFSQEHLSRYSWLGASAHVWGRFLPTLQVIYQVSQKTCQNQSLSFLSRSAW